MKKIKVLLGVFALSCVFSIIGVKATHTAYFASIDIPSLQGNYTSSTYYKEQYGTQYAKKLYATDKLSGDERGIQGRLQGITTSYASLPKNVTTALPMGDTNLGQIVGNYNLQLRASSYLVTGAYCGAFWYLDGTSI